MGGNRREAVQPRGVARPGAPSSADLGDLEAFNVVYGAWFEAPPPARSTIDVDLPGGILVEIEAIARRATAGEGGANR